MLYTYNSSQLHTLVAQLKILDKRQNPPGSPPDKQEYAATCTDYYL
jgi:hypothetical protein